VERPLKEPSPGPAPGPSLPPVELSAFSGPLDLLLHLIRVNEVSITDIPIVEITEQYTAYLDLMQELDLDVAAEYVYLAAVLIHIKSRSLLPRDPSAAGEDPRQELVDRLLEYEKFKRAAESLHEVDTLRAGLWSRPEEGAPPSGEPPTLEVSLVDLVGAFRIALDRYRLAHPSAIALAHPRFSMRMKMRELLERVEAHRSLPLLDLLGRFEYRSEAITTFLAALELTRLGVIRLFQPAPFAEIHAARTEREFDAARIDEEYDD
jgi:segregation and condensation protein A